MLPEKIALHKKSRTLELGYSDGLNKQLSSEFLRVLSPSAEVRGHGEGQEILQVGKIHVALTAVEPVGHYGLKLIFDDGHDSGIYTWDYLRELCEKQGPLWQEYLNKLDQVAESRDPDVGVVRLIG